MSMFDKAKDLFSLFDDTVQRLLGALRCAGTHKCREKQDAGSDK